MEITDQAGFCSVNGTCLYYEMAGDSPDHVVLIHGMAFDTRMWSDQFAAFSAKHTVVRYDMRGFGRSDMPAEGQLYSAVDDLRALLEALNISSASLVGLSLGGGVALDFALTYPNMTKALVLADSIVGGWHWSPAWTSYSGPVWATGKSDGVAAARSLWINMPLFAPAFEQPSVRERLEAMLSDYTGWHWTNDDPQVNLDPPADERLDELHLPVLVIVGARDEPDFHAIADTLGARIAGATRVVIPNVGHMSNLEAPTIFNRAVLDFLG